MLTRLAVRNVKRQFSSYLIYFITIVLSVSLIFAVNTVIFGKQVADYVRNVPESIQGMILILLFISFVIAFVLGYATSFLLKLRKREFGTYLTFGMTRKNILTLFFSETMLICLTALGFGILLGLFIYQGFMGIMMKLMEMEFALSSYSFRGLLFTVALVISIFLLASLASARYLKKVSIYELLHSAQKVEKTVRHPNLWVILTLLSLCLFIGSILKFYQSTEQMFLTGSGSSQPQTMIILVFSGSLLLFYAGLSRSVVYLLSKSKRFCSRGTNTFVLRSLSGTLKANSAMMGLIALLLSFSVILSNVSFVQRAQTNASIDYSFPYDALYAKTSQAPASENKIPVTEAEAIIETYKKILNKYVFTTYTTGGQELHNCTKWAGKGRLTDSFLSESDFNSMITALGYEPVDLNDEFLIVGTTPEVKQEAWEKAVLTLEGTTYHFQGVTTDYPRLTFDTYFYAVVPDRAIDSMTPAIKYIAYDLEDGKYDAHRLRQELSYTAGAYERSDFILKEYQRQKANSSLAILIVGALFIASIFLFLTMAILALKTLSGISEDKKRYQILFRLGGGEREQSKALFRQTFSFFLLPFLIPLLMNIPTAMVCGNILEMYTQKYEAYQIAAVIALIMTLIYFLYYTATYLISKRAVIHSSISQKEPVL